MLSNSNAIGHLKLLHKTSRSDTKSRRDLHLSGEATKRQAGHPKAFQLGIDVIRQWKGWATNHSLRQLHVNYLDNLGVQALIVINGGLVLNSDV